MSNAAGKNEFQQTQTLCQTCAKSIDVRQYIVIQIASEKLNEQEVASTEETQAEVTDNSTFVLNRCKEIINVEISRRKEHLKLLERQSDICLDNYKTSCNEKETSLSKVDVCVNKMIAHVQNKREAMHKNILGNYDYYIAEMGSCQKEINKQREQTEREIVQLHDALKCDYLPSTLSSALQLVNCKLTCPRIPVKITPKLRIEADTVLPYCFKVTETEYKIDYYYLIDKRLEAAGKHYTSDRIVRMCVAGGVLWYTTESGNICAYDSTQGKILTTLQLKDIVKPRGLVFVDTVGLIVAAENGLFQLSKNIPKQLKDGTFLDVTQHNNVIYALQIQPVLNILSVIKVSPILFEKQTIQISRKSFELGLLLEARIFVNDFGIAVLNDNTMFIHRNCAVTTLTLTDKPDSTVFFCGKDSFNNYLFTDYWNDCLYLVDGATGRKDFVGLPDGLHCPRDAKVCSHLEYIWIVCYDGLYWFKIV